MRVGVCAAVHGIGGDHMVTVALSREEGMGLKEGGQGAQRRRFDTRDYTQVMVEVTLADTALDIGTLPKCLNHHN